MIRNGTKKLVPKWIDNLGFHKHKYFNMYLVFVRIKYGAEYRYPNVGDIVNDEGKWVFNDLKNTKLTSNWKKLIKAKIKELQVYTKGCK